MNAPPRWAAALLQLLAPPGRADDVLGDLNEMYGRRLRRRGRLVAYSLTALEALDMAVALVRHRIRRQSAVNATPPGNKQRSRNADANLRRDHGGGDRNRNSRKWQMLHTLEGWIRDFMHAARVLRRARGFTVVTVVTLALAIGANTAIFSVIDTVLLDPLDFPAADRLVSIRASAPGTDLPEEFGPAPEFYVEYSENADMLEDLGMFRQYQSTMRTEEQIDRLFMTLATPSMFSTLGATVAAGRLPTAEDDPMSVAVISHWLWTTWFDRDPAVIGRSYEMAGDFRTVVGVMKPEFRFPDARTALWVHATLGDENEMRPGRFGYNLVGRMTPGTQHVDLESQLAVLATRLPERFGGSAQYARIIEQHRPIVRSLEEELVGDVARPLWLLLGTVALVLLIASANVANLFAVRAESRRRDLAVRLALGAGRAGLVRVQMTEALLLALLGGAGGALLAWAGLPLLVRAAPENVPNLDVARIDLAALAFTAGVSILAACAFGLMPALRYSKQRLVGALPRTGAGGDTRSHLSRNAFVLVQTAGALVLLVGSGLLIRSFWTLSRVDPGYSTENIFSFQIAPDRDELNNGPSFAQFHYAFMERVAGLPGVESVGLTNWLPLDEGAATNRFTTQRMLISGEQPPPLRFTFVGGDYFQTMGIAVTSGRRFERSDHTGGAVNAIVSRAAARQLWPNEDALGQRFLHSADTTGWITVVGIAEDIFLEDFRQDAPDPMIYLPMVGPKPDSWVVGSPAYVVKSSRAELLAPDIRNLMREVVPESPMYRIFTMEGLAARSMAQLSFTMLMLAIASGLALVLGAVGLYGVLSYVVSNRVPEIAVRMALGAQAPQVRRMVVVQGARVTLAGVVVGVLAAFALTRVLESLLFGVGALDAPTFVSMSGLMLAVALLASYIPARRASSVDPMQSLKSE